MRSVKLSGALLALTALSYLAYDQLGPAESADALQAATNPFNRFSTQHDVTTFCNGQPAVVEGVPMYPNGQRIAEGTTYYYPNGQVVFDGRGHWPNGQEWRDGDVYYYPNGQVTRDGYTLRYPNGQRVAEGDDFYYPNGQPVKGDEGYVRPDGQPIGREGKTTRFTLEADGDRYRGLLDLYLGNLKDVRITTALASGWEIHMVVNFSDHQVGVPSRFTFTYIGDDHRVEFSLDSLNYKRRPLISEVRCDG